MIVVAILIFRAKYALEIEGGESSDLASQLLEINSTNNIYVNSILESITCRDEKKLEPFKDILARGISLDSYVDVSFNVIHFVIRDICYLIEFALFRVDDEEILMRAFDGSNLGNIPFVRHSILENVLETSIVPFLELILYDEVEKNFEFAFDRFLGSLTKRRTKIKNLEDVNLVLRIACHTSEFRALQLVNLIDFDGEDIANIVSYDLVDRLPLKIKLSVLEEIYHAYERRGIAVTNSGALINLTPSPRIRIDDNKVSGSILRYYIETEPAFAEFFINDQGSIEIVPAHLLLHVPLFDGIVNVHLTTGYFFIIKCEFPELGESFVTIIPFLRPFESMKQVLFIISEIFRVFIQASRSQTFLNMVDFYCGSCLKFRRKM